MRSVGTAVIGLCALAAICAGVAGAAGGGDTIATAPVVPAGAPQSGNTSSFTDTCQNGFEFWMLQLKQGDLVKITWNAPPAVDALALFPTGTSDAAHDGCLYASDWSQWTVSPVLSDSNETPATTRLSQSVVPANGNYPLLFLDTTGTQNAGAYTFTAVVLHGASVSLPHVSAIPGNGTLTADVRAPDHSPISDSSLKLTLKGYWSTVAGSPPSAHKLATATPSNGTAQFDYRLPPRLWRKKIRLQITGGGSSYQAVTSQKESVKVLIPEIGPVLLSSHQLAVESNLLRQPIYWAGPKHGSRYEFTRATNGYVYVRYLPHGVRAGHRGTKWLIVATYPVRGAFSALKKYAHGKAVAGPNRSIFYVRPDYRKSVLMAFPGVNDQIEVYGPSPAVARAIVESGRVRPVR